MLAIRALSTWAIDIGASRQDSFIQRDGTCETPGSGTHAETDSVKIAHWRLPGLLTLRLPEKAYCIFSVGSEHTWIDAHTIVPLIVVGSERISTQWAYITQPVTLCVVHCHSQFSLYRHVTSVLRMNSDVCRGDELRSVLFYHLDTSHMGYRTIVLDTLSLSTRANAHNGMLHVVERATPIGYHL